MLKRAGRIIALGLIVVVQTETMVSLMQAHDGLMTPAAVETIALPVTPLPADCRVEPRPLDFFAADADDLLATPAASFSEPVTTPVAYLPVRGAPADSETVNRVTAVLVQAMACLNAGDFLRYSSLLTDEAAHDTVRYGMARNIQYVRSFRAEQELGDFSTDALLAEFAGELRPTPEDQWAAVTAVHQVSLLADGRVAAVVLLSNPGLGDGSLVMVFERERGRFLIAERISLVYPPLPPATPAGSPPATPHVTPLPDDCKTEPPPIACIIDVAAGSPPHGPPPISGGRRLVTRLGEGTRRGAGPARILWRTVGARSSVG